MMALPPEMVAESNGHVTFYVEVPDVAATLAKAEELGGKRLQGPDTVPNGPTLGQLADPEGHLIGVTQAGTR
jgi:predicted enzyme related to lactoylglutathione lyase